ncbi:MAG TPA: hypothetical protein VGL26_08485 [Jatrophihabitans sp.]|jgi:hypothetical protein
MTLTRPEETFVRSQAELMQLWVDLMRPGGFDVASIWLIFLAADGELSPVIVPIDNIAAEPDEEFVQGLSTNIRAILENAPVSSVAVLLARPGSAALTQSDRRWARSLDHSVAAPNGGWPVHLATHGNVRIIAPDDLLQ